MQPNVSTWSGPNRLRTSDTEREQIATILRSAMTEGRLTLEEGEERLSGVYAAKFRDELAPLTADLPNGGRQALAETPQARATTRRDLRRHTGFVMFAALLLTGLWFASGATFFWPVFPLAFLFMGLIRHAKYGNMRRDFHHYGHVAPWNSPGWK
ncbi:DUF1707 domain-containing protein [Winogradskya consettensis]|uniref:DUF1707 domain-containing protein n=1 Tax=Winogradskya consettensis TaxID=113560 RepID=A0A919T0N7_9ACTN|nr:DUF1707 domain-containing protein [Actinoplanes consettensis]GIM81393.1 hypothetical protein Aco04nite_76350 [Actinoplanes consettensis]